jgi:hypothetical protein
MKVYHYNQNCVQAGQGVSARTLDEHDGNIDEAGDWSVVEGTEAELLEIARAKIESAKTAGAGTDRYRRRVATTIMEALMMDDDAIDLELNGPREDEDQSIGVDEGIANARLIAAAPDLLAVALAIIDLWDANGEPNYYTAPMSVPDLRIMAEEAIARATGRNEQVAPPAE